MKKLLLIILTLIVIMAVIAIAGIFFLQKNNSEVKVSYSVENKSIKIGLTDEQLKEEIGQMIMVGFYGIKASEASDVYKVIKDAKVGGITFFDFDIPSNSSLRNFKDKEQVKELISDLQSFANTPLFISVDAEGGSVNRLKQKYGFYNIVSAEAMGQDKTLNTTENESEKLSQELKETGFNMNLAPVVDLNLNPKNPIIGALGRSFSADELRVYNNAKVFIQNHKNNNIISVAKHFPGQGSALTDTHLGLTDITKTFNEKELYPYKKLNEAKLLDVVMTGHLIDKNIDPNYPATLSKNFLISELRNKIGFQGVIMSDDMQMSALTENYNFDESIILAINAGVNIISISNNTKAGYDANIAFKARDIIFNAVKDKKIDEKTIIDSYDRIIKLKKQFRIIKPSAQEIKNKDFELLQSESLSFKEAYNLAKYVQSITKVRPAFLLAISQEELGLEKIDMCYVTNFLTGEGVREIDNKKMLKVMHPSRDAQLFLKITKGLNKDPYKTLVTCPMSFGWGGAMGPADFIPSTWEKYALKVETILNKKPDPWDKKDAFLAMGLYLADSGAVSLNQKGEWESAMIYFSGSADSGYNFYANQVLDLADKIQKDIDIIEAK